MPSHLPDRAEAAAVELLSLADAIEARGPASTRTLVRVADILVWTPSVHPLRNIGDREDAVERMATRIRKGDMQDKPGELRAFAEALRAGRPEMFKRGWGWMLGGAR